MTDFPRNNLIRMSTDVHAEAGDDGRRTLVGVPIVFNTWTEINGWEGRFKEQIAPGALTKTLAERGDKVKVLFNHGYDPQIGEKPLGKPSVMEPRSDGLYVEVPLADTSYNKDLEALLDAGAIDGMSFRFGVISDEWENLDGKDGLPERTITELRLMELGPVTFPAYEATTVGVRSRTEYEDYRSRRQHLEAQMQTIPDGEGLPPETDGERVTMKFTVDAAAVKEDLEGAIREAVKRHMKISKPEAARGTSADDEPTTSHSVSKQDISALLRKVILVQKGVS